MTPKPGDRVTTLHDCTGISGKPLTHDAEVLVTAVDHCVVGTRIRAIACDNRRIEWIAEADQ